MRRVAIVVAVCTLLLLVGGAHAIITRPRTYREAVMQMLDARQIAYDEVEVDTGCPPSPHCL